MTKLTTELLEKFVSDIKTDGMCEITDSQVESALIKLLAYEQAAKNPAEYKVVSRFGDISLRNQKCEAEMYRSMKGFSVTPLYAAPVLPKQPELIGMKVSIDTGSDNIGHRLFGEIVCTSDSNGVPVLCIEVAENNGDMAAPAQPVIPAEKEKPKYDPTATWGYQCIISAEINGWNACRAEMLKAQQNEPQNIPENIPAQPVIPEHSGDNLPCPFCGGEVDVSGWRSLNGNSGPECNECGATTSNLSDWNKRTAQPVSEPYKLPQGYALVPCKLTAENGAKSCMIGEFTEQTEISCPECFGDDECETCDGSGMIEVTVPVSWTTIKDIWSKGIEHFAATAAQESE